MTTNTNPKYYVLTRRSKAPGREHEREWFVRRARLSMSGWTEYPGQATLFTEEQARCWGLFVDVQQHIGEVGSVDTQHALDHYTAPPRMLPWEDPCEFGHDVMINDVRESHVARHEGGNCYIELTLCLMCDRCGATMLYDIRSDLPHDRWIKAADRLVDMNEFFLIDTENDKEQS